MLFALLLLLAQSAPLHRRHAPPPAPVAALVDDPPYHLPAPPRGGREPARYRDAVLAPFPPLPPLVRPAAAWAMTVDAFALARIALVACAILIAWQRWQRRVARRGVLALRPPYLRARVNPPRAIEPVALDPEAPVLHRQSAPDPVPTFASYPQPRALQSRSREASDTLYHRTLRATLAALFHVPVEALRTQIDPARGEAIKWHAWLGAAPTHADTLRARGATEAAALKALLRRWQARHGTWSADEWTRIAVERHGGAA